MDAFEAVVEVQAVRGAAGELGARSELAVTAERGLWKGKVSLPFQLGLACVTADGIIRAHARDMTDFVILKHARTPTRRCVHSCLLRYVF